MSHPRGFCTEKILRTSGLFRGLSATTNDAGALVQKILGHNSMKDLFKLFMGADVFGEALYTTLESDLELLHSAKELKFFFCIPLGQVFHSLSGLYRTTPHSAWWAAVAKNIGGSDLKGVKTQDFLRTHGMPDYEDLRAKMAIAEPHSVYPTNIYRYYLDF